MGDGFFSGYIATEFLAMKLSRFAALFLMIGLCPSMPAFAGQLEDGIAAHDRQDYATAQKLLRPLAEKGGALAQHKIGFMYSFGQGVQKDPVEAGKWYRKAADQGLAKSQNNLGYIYAKGEGVARDDVESAKWYKKSAEQGNAGAQSALSQNYAKGAGVAQNLVEAHKWSDLAASNSLDKFIHDRNIKNRDSLVSSMTPAQVAEAQKLAREWKPKQEPSK